MQLSRRFLLAVLAFTFPCLSQVKESLLIGPGDIVHIQVFETSELEQATRVSDSGQLELKLGGDVKLAGTTAQEAGHIIEARLRQLGYIKDPHVLVSVQEYATQKVSVYGEVKNPGVFSISTARPIVSVLAMAGGLTDLADRHIIVERHGTSEKIPYFVSNSPQDQTHVLNIEPGDTVTVPKVKIVYILGDVRLPGGYTMANNQSSLTVLQLVARAGGTNYSAVPSNSRLIRKNDDGGSTETKLPLSDMQKGKKPDQVLKGDDIVYVPFSYLRNLVTTGSGGIPASVASSAIYRF